MPQTDNKGYGTFYYKADFTLNAPPQVAFSSTRLEQGGVVVVRVTGILDAGVQPTIDTDLSLAHFVQTDDGWVAYIGLHYNREPGDYTVTVRCGELEMQQTITVVHRNYEKQYLTIDENTVAQTATAAANAEWRNIIWPLYETAGDTIYWQGQFVRPTESETVNTPYGVFRYTNGSTTPERHAGIDLDGEQGDPVYAAARGKVVYAGYLQLTGNTIVIEHGAGLKTYYFHMDSLNCAEGDLVEKGQRIGAIGSTGYATGPHLHFEARIGNQSVDPVALWRGTSGLYTG
jgi:murein DD-endopeptidase MepM/ murein hydrolase activator NlpD